jgi:hypothetical protein
LIAAGLDRERRAFGAVRHRGELPAVYLHPDGRIRVFRRCCYRYARYAVSGTVNSDRSGRNWGT